METPKVLIVEDSQATRESLAQAVMEAGNTEVHTADRGFKALNILVRHRFSLIITDLNVPDLSGFELINFVKKNPRYRHTPLLVVTARTSEEDRKRGLALGADEYIVKPCEASVVTAIVRRYLSLST